MDLEQTLWNMSAAELRRVRALVDVILASKEGLGEDHDIDDVYDDFEFGRDVPPEVEDAVMDYLEGSDVKSLGRLAASSRRSRDLSRRHLERVKEADRASRRAFEDALDVVYRTYSTLSRHYDVHHPSHVYGGLTSADSGGNFFDEAFMTSLRKDLGGTSVGDLTDRLKAKAATRAGQPFEIVSFPNLYTFLEQSDGTVAPSTEKRRFERGTTAGEVAELLNRGHGTVSYNIRWL